MPVIYYSPALQKTSNCRNAAMQQCNTTTLSRTNRRLRPMPIGPSTHRMPWPSWLPQNHTSLHCFSTRFDSESRIHGLCRREVALFPLSRAHPFSIMFMTLGAICNTCWPAGPAKTWPSPQPSNARTPADRSQAKIFRAPSVESPASYESYQASCILDSRL